MIRVLSFKFNFLSSVLLISLVFILGVNPASARRGPGFFPNLPLVNQDGKVIKFYDDLIKGKVVAINFMFTTCEDSCPLETAKLRNVYQLLGDHVGKNVHMYSISVDPEVDTPAVLKDYMKKFQIGPNWDFLTGKKKDIDLIRKKLGMYTTKEEEALSDHAITFMLGNEETGQWIKRSPFDLPETLVTVLLGRLQKRSLLTSTANPTYAQSQFVRAAEDALKGEDLFKSRCASCHTFGQGNELGPDLLGVTSTRDRAWMIRWLQEPDVMLKEKDPIATVLDASYKDIVMPNLKLGEKEAVALIEFMKDKSRRVMQEKRAKMVDHSAHQHDHHPESHTH